MKSTYIAYAKRSASFPPTIGRQAPSSLKRFIKVKIFIYSSLLGLCLLLASCNMEKDPIGLLTPDQISDSPSEATLKSAVNSAYEPLRNTTGFLGDGSWDKGLFIRPDFVIEDIAAGDMNKKWASDGDQAWMDEVGRFSFTAENPAFNGLWTYAFEGISRSNLAIDKLSNPTIVQQANMDADLANRMLGEVLFLRAYFYFELVTNFGDVPLLTKPLTDFDEAYEVAVRVPKEQIWQQINTDLQQAEQLLPDTKYASEEEPWRVALGTVLALEAKVALFNEQWQDVLLKIDALQQKGYFSLNSNYFDSFDNSKKFKDQEVVFAYNHTQGTLPKNGNGIGSLLGWGFIAPTDDFVASFEANDPRLDYTVDRENRLVYKLMGELNAANRGNGDSPANKILIRWADILLWKSEAYLETGDYPQAIRLINEVRARARNTPTVSGGKAPTGTLSDRNTQVSDPALIRTWLMQERRTELGFESHRFSDLRRWQTAEEVLRAMGKNFNSRNYLYPVPQREIDLSGGTISQNVGY
ncbi:RagB/SusD family nutrient uptake outer membrane protein [Olivibacter sp. CPCC 100613]|uniref:RagB/SusD family nutrient uptake outer membrane protein n=1 Tax=Olivibacter sp. CPCC 100613 TaxID=3079931 RepID=UPI002FF4F526